MSGTSRASISPGLLRRLHGAAPTAVLISPAAVWLRSASLRTSEATTAKPRPCSPARAASTAAFSASRSVCRAISCTMVIFSAIVCIAATAALTASPLAWASVADCRAIFSVWLALSAFCLMLADISSIEADASSVEDACSLAPCAMDCADALDSSLPLATCSAASCTSTRKAGQVVDQRVDASHQQVIIAGVVLGDLAGDVAFGDAVDEVAGHSQRRDHRLQGVVEAFDDTAVFAMVLGGVRADRQFALGRGFHQRVGVANHAGDVRLEQHQPFVDLVVLRRLVHLGGHVAAGDGGHIGNQVLQPGMDAIDGFLHALVVALAIDLDPLPEIAAADEPQHTVAFADRHQDGVQHLVDALDDLAVGALERRHIAALVQLPLVAELGQLGHFGLELLQDDGDAVDVLLHLLMVALVGLGDHFVDLAVGDLVENAVAFADRQEDGVEHLVDALDDLAVGALERRRRRRASDSWPWRLNSVSFASSAWNFCRTAAMPLTFCFIFSWSP